MKLYSNYSFSALEKGMDYLWEKQKLIQHNIANYETPNFKAKTMSFKDVLEGATNTSIAQNETRFQTKTHNSKGLSLRPDGNNVNLEKENIDLWEDYFRYSFLTQKMTTEFKNMRYVISQSFK